MRLQFRPPRARVLADRGADARPRGHAPGLDEVDVATEAERAVAAGVAGQHPADRLLGAPQLRQVLLGLARVVPEQIHVEPAGRDVEVERLHDRAVDPLDGVQPRAGLEPFGQALPLEDPLHGGGVGLPPEVPEPGEDAPGLVRSHRLQQVLPELREGVHVVQDEPPPLQAQLPLREVHQLVELQVFGFHVSFISI